MDTTAEALKQALRAYHSTIGRLGGKKGGKKRWENLSPEQRSEVMKAVRAAREAKRATDAGKEAGAA
jgi:hypothetical protein